MLSALLLSTVLLGVSYEDAYHQANTEKSPLIIYIGAEWCGPCKVNRPILHKVYSRYVYLDADEDNKRVYQLMKEDDAIPRLIFFFKKSGQWYRKQDLVGVQTENIIEKFLELENPRLP